MNRVEIWADLEMKDACDILIQAASAARRSQISELVRRAGDKAVVTRTTADWSALGLDQALPDIWVVDLHHSSAAWSLLRLMDEHQLAVAMVTLVDNPEPGWVKTALGYGVNAIIRRDPEPEELGLALEAAEAGLILLHPSSARRLISALLTSSEPLRGEPEPLTETEPLTKREREVLRLISDGLGNKEIAHKLGISEHTAKFHISSILAKLEVSGRAEAVSQGIRRGLIAI